MDDHSTTYMILSSDTDGHPLASQEAYGLEGISTGTRYRITWSKEPCVATHRGNVGFTSEWKKMMKNGISGREAHRGSFTDQPP